MLIELPKLDAGGSSPARMSKVFGKLRNCALKAKKVVVIAPSRNGHWDDWKEFFDTNKYQHTDHFWCSLGIKDDDSAKPIGYVTTIWSTCLVDSHSCQCGEARSHAYELRQERCEEEIKTGQSNPNQRAYEDWATIIILLLRVRP